MGKEPHWMAFWSGSLRRGGRWVTPISPNQLPYRFVGQSVIRHKWRPTHHIQLSKYPNVKYVLASSFYKWWPGKTSSGLEFLDFTMFRLECNPAHSPPPFSIYLQLHLTTGGSLHTCLHKKKVTHVALNPCCDWLLATASVDQTVKIWDLRQVKGKSSFLYSLPHRHPVNAGVI